MPRKPQAKVAKSPREVDVQVGQRIRIFRLEKGMSQEKLAKGLGLTFQQVQKYEKGVNRIGASRMVEIAKVLNVPVHVLFGSENYGEEPADVGILALAAADTVGATKMLQHYNSISTDTLRALAIRILAALAQCEGTRPPTGDEA